MSTHMLPCGCHISWSMFGERPIMAISFCTHHCELAGVQEALEAVHAVFQTVTADNFHWPGPEGEDAERFNLGFGQFLNCLEQSLPQA